MFKVIYCISVYKRKNHIIITIDTEEALYKSQQLLFIFKKPMQQGHWNIPHVLKARLNLKANIMLKEKILALC